MCASKIFHVLMPLVPGLLLGGCAWFSDSGEQPEEMTISVDFSQVHRCSRISPEITVAHAPQGTKFYDVRLLEYGNVERLQGGGTWVEDGTGVIPEGALTRHYMGPCPPDGANTEYAYVVSAMESENSQPLAVRIYRFRPE